MTNCECVEAIAKVFSPVLLFLSDDTWGRAETILRQHVAEQTAAKDVELYGAIGLLEDNIRLRTAIQWLYDQRFDDRCWLDLEALFVAAGLPVTRTDFALHCPEEMLANCRKFIASMQPDGVAYVSPNREIERLTAEVARLQAIVNSFADRIAAQSALLSKRAAKGAV